MEAAYNLKTLKHNISHESKKGEVARHRNGEGQVVLRYAGYSQEKFQFFIIAKF